MARRLVVARQSLGCKAGRQDSQALLPDRSLPLRQQHKRLLETMTTARLLATN